MILTRLAIRFCLVAAAMLVLTTLSVGLWTALWPLRGADSFAPAEAIICLGAGISVDGSVDPAGQRRVARCIELYDAGRAPIVVFTAGSARADSPSGASAMAALPVARTLPESAVGLEEQAQSTLQNALFSLGILDGSQDLILVTEAFHLPRSWASFKWAGAGRLQLAASERVRRHPQDPNRPHLSMLTREVAAIWFNLARAAAYSVGGMVGIASETRVNWLH